MKSGKGRSENVYKGFIAGGVFLLTSIILYAVQVFIFKKPGDTLFYFLQDIAFLPIQAAIVTFVINGYIEKREKHERLKKMNMAINAFFGQFGVAFLKIVIRNAIDAKTNGKPDFSHLLINNNWTKNDYLVGKTVCCKQDISFVIEENYLQEMKQFLLTDRSFLLSLLGNSNLLEHDEFSEMLWAVFHLMDELALRENLGSLPQKDCDHLSLDIKRAYSAMIIQWLSYLEHMKSDFPYMFLMAVRTNPFDPDADPVIT